MPDKQAEKLWAACRTGNERAVLKLIANKIDVNVVLWGGKTVLMPACFEGRANIVKILITHGISINHQAENMMTPLMNASINNKLDIVELLIENGADVTMKDKHGKTAFFYALEFGADKVSDFFLKSGLNANITDIKGKFAYDLAIKRGNFQQLCLSKYDMLNKIDCDGNTFLMKVCDAKQTDDIIFLINRGADFYRVNNENKSAFSILKRKRNLTCSLQALKEKLMLTFDDEDENLVGL